MRRRCAGVPVRLERTALPPGGHHLSSAGVLPTVAVVVVAVAEPLEVGTRSKVARRAAAPWPKGRRCSWQQRFAAGVIIIRPDDASEHRWDPTLGRCDRMMLVALCICSLRRFSR